MVFGSPLLIQPPPDQFKVLYYKYIYMYIYAYAYVYVYVYVIWLVESDLHPQMPFNVDPTTGAWLSLFCVP